VTGRHAAVVYDLDEQAHATAKTTPLPRRFSIRHTFPNGETIGDGLARTGTRSDTIAEYDRETADDLVRRMRAHAPTHTFELVENCPLHGPTCEAWS